MTNTRGGWGRRGLIAACVLVIVLANAARADAFIVPSWEWKAQSSAPAVVQGWAWQVQRRGAPSLGPVSGIPSGDLAVAWLRQPDKLSYLGIGGTGARSLAGATLELAVDPEAPNIEHAGAQMQACVIVLEWEAAEPMPWDAKPPTVCDAAAPGRYNESAEAFAFDLGPMADALASAAVYGISIEPVDAPESSFQVVFKAGGIRLRVPAPPSPPAGEAEAPAPEPVVTGDDLQAYAPAEASPVASPQPQPTPSSSTAVAAATQQEDGSRPVSLGLVYGMVAMFAALALGGRVLALALRSKREHER